MYKIRLENTVTHQIYEQDVVDANNGDKLYFRFGVNTTDLADGEYILTLFNENGDVLVEDILRIGDFNPETLQYSRGENTYISFELDAVLSEKSVVINEINTKITTDSGVDGLTAVYVDAQPVYDMGVNDQKSRLEAIKITENGTYSREDGYNEIEVEVPDLNGSYDDGYGDGYNTGYAEGEQVSYGNGYNDGYNQAEGIIAENAQVLNITENGIYRTQYSTPYIPENITGVFDDGTPFYDYVMLSGITYNTGIYVSENTEVEIWWKGDVSIGNKAIFGSQISLDSIFKIRTPDNAGGVIDAEINRTQVKFTNAQSDKWYHFKMSYADGFWVDDVKIGDFSRNVTGEMYPIYINSTNGANYFGINGCFGMMKIDGNIIIPTLDGFRNLTTGEMLEIADQNYIANYEYFSDSEIYGEGNLIKTVNVNVSPNINIADEKIKFSYSSFTTLPEWADFTNVTSMYYMFSNCSNLTTIPLLDTSKVTNMERMFYNCDNLTTIPLLDTSKVINMSYMFNSCDNLTTIPLLDTSKVTTMTYMFNESMKIEEIPPIDTSKVTNMSYMFYSYSTEHKLRKLPEFDCTNVTDITRYFSYYQDRMPYFTDCGGWKNLKQKWDDNYGLRACANLTYESCINILNGLYDFVGNGVTPTSNQAKLKVHQNFLNLVGDEISIGVAKGWSISA